MEKINKEFSQKSNEEKSLSDELFHISQYLLPKYGHQWNIHNLVSLKRQSLSRILYYNYLYEKIIHVPGVICEFGVQWGAGISQLINLRGIYEPFNYSRKIFGFDTFEGFVSIDKKDHNYVEYGDYSTIFEYEKILDRILTIHESFCPLSHIKKFELIKGDASLTIDKWIDDNPYAVISMVIFDMDVYTPTKNVLTKIIPKLTKGSLLVFDELNCPHFPGETIAVSEVLGLNNISLRRHPHQPHCAWAVFGD